MSGQGCGVDAKFENVDVGGALNVTGDFKSNGSLNFKKNVNAAVLAPNVSDSGTTFVCDNTARAIVLPACSANDIGTNFKFIFTENIANAHTISTGDLTDGTGDVFIGGFLVHSAAAVNTYVECGNNISRITLDEDVGDAACGVGSYVQCTMVSATQWFLEGIINGNTDVDGDGSAVLSNAA